MWLIVVPVPAAAASPFLALTATAWALVEVPRYLFYCYDLLRVEPPYALKWLRYSLFIVLYPAGISGEVGCLITALPVVAATRMWSVDLPNAHNFAYNHAVLLAIALVLYVPGSILMISHMWAMRGKKLGGGRAAAKSD